MATPAIAMAVPIPVCVEILFPAKSFSVEWLEARQQIDYVFLGKTRGGLTKYYN